MTASFIEYCINGDIMSIRKMSLKGCDLEHGFRVASLCLNGHYMLIRYLTELHKNNDIYMPPIDIYFDEYGFRGPCTHGHYKIINYLLRVTIKHKYKPFNNYLMAFKKFDKFLL